MLSGRTPNTECAVKEKREKKVIFCFVLFCFFKNKGQERDQQESQSRSGFRDTNVLTEDQGGNLLKRR